MDKRRTVETPIHTYTYICSSGVAAFGKVHFLKSTMIRARDRNRDNRFPVLSRIMGRVKRANETRRTMRHAVPVDLWQYGDHGATRVKWRIGKSQTGSRPWKIAGLSPGTRGIVTFYESLFWGRMIDLDSNNREYIFMNFYIIV